MATIGKVKELAKTEFTFEWNIDDFFSLSEEDYHSPDFLMDGEYWYLAIRPNGESRNNSVGNISVYFYRKLSGSSKNMSWTFSLKTVDGKKDCEWKTSYVFTKAEGWGRPQFLKRVQLLEKKSTLVPDGVLTVICTTESCSKSTTYNAGDTAKVKCSDCKKELEVQSLPSHKQKCLDKPVRCPTCSDLIGLRNYHGCTPIRVKGHTVIVKCSDCKEELDVESLPSHKQKCLDKPVRCPTCSDVIELRKWFDHECSMIRVKANEKLLDDLASICDAQEHSDIIITVKNEEFRLHKNILAGRNPYFKSTLNAEMKEKAAGTVSIKDCEPDVFRSFIHFLYTGKVDDFSVGNVTALYELADKYQEDQLKEECVCFMKNTISVDSFCDFVVLALGYDEKGLLKNATDLFCREIKEIVTSVKWQSFIKQYPTESSELHIKAANYMANKLQENFKKKMFLFRNAMCIVFFIMILFLLSLSSIIIELSFKLDEQH